MYDCVKYNYEYNEVIKAVKSGIKTVKISFRLKNLFRLKNHTGDGSVKVLTSKKC